MNRGILTKGAMLAGVAALGALTMYFFDPTRGRHRRALCIGKLSGVADIALEAAESKSRHLTERVRSVLAEARSAVKNSLSHEDETTGGELKAA